MDYNNIYEFLYQNGYHKDFGYTHSKTLITKVINTIPVGSRILDVGCSNGTAVKTLLDLGYDAYGIDISETAIELAKINGCVNCTVGSATSIPFEDNYFDAIITSDVLEHICKTDIESTLVELYRTTKKYTFLRIAIEEEKNRTWVDLLNKNGYNINNLHITLMTPQEWAEFFTNVGFIIVEEKLMPNNYIYELTLMKN